MRSISQETRSLINSPVRQIYARVELYSTEEDSLTLVDVFGADGALINFTVERVGDESKFFGFGVYQKINVKIIDRFRALTINTSNQLKVVYTVNGEDITPYPLFKVSEVHRDEKTNELSITAYDRLDKTKSDSIPLEELKEFINNNIDAATPQNNKPGKIIDLCSSLLGLGDKAKKGCMAETLFMEFNNVEQFNFDGTETFKDLLDALAEITHAIYFINGDNELAFYDLSGMFHPRLVIDNSMYIDLNTKENRRLTTVVHTTDLNDNINATSGLSGTTQYIRDNPFMALNTEYTVEVLEDAIEVFKDISLPQYDLEWRGNPTVEVLDALHIVTKDGNTLYGFLINDTTEYNGSLSQSTSWNYQDNEEETDSTPTSIGEAIKQTYAKIDKANQEISLVVTSTDEKIKSANEDIDEIKKEVSLKLNEEAVKI
jgi:hypothetical protein